MIRLASEVSSSEETHSLVDTCIDDLCKQIINIRLSPRNVNDDGNDTLVRVSEGVIQPKGFKKQIGLKRKRRLRNWVELQSNRKRRPLAIKSLQVQQSRVYKFILVSFC